MKRVVKAEWLDTLPAEDQRARRSRDDLLRLNSWMGNARMLARTLRQLDCGTKPRRLLDVGAGDGRFMCRVARRLPDDWRGTQLSLLDRQPPISPATRRGLEGLGWNVSSICADVNDWFRKPFIQLWSVTCANLFLHHFADGELPDLLMRISERTKIFIALEPRRSIWALVASKMVGLIGCNRVTRHDAVISVRAGFAGNALSDVWPKTGDWLVEERAAGPFSHLFVAERKPHHECLSGERSS